MTSTELPSMRNIALALTGGALLLGTTTVIGEDKRGIPPPPSPMEKAIRSLADMPKLNEKTWDRPHYELPDLVPVIITTDPCWIQLKVSNISNRGVPEAELNESKLWFEVRYDDGRIVGDHRDLHDLSGYRNLLRGFSGTHPFVWPLLSGESATFTIEVDSNHEVIEVTDGNNGIVTGSSCPE